MKQNKFTKKKPVVDIEVSDIPQNTKATSVKPKRQTDFSSAYGFIEQRSLCINATYGRCRDRQSLKGFKSL